MVGCTGSDGGSKSGGDGGAVRFWQLCVDSTVILLVSGRNRHDDGLRLIEISLSLLISMSRLAVRPGAMNLCNPPHLHVSHT